MPEPYGVVETGFNRKRLDEILEDLNIGVKSVFGENTNLRPQSVHGQFNGLMADFTSVLWELAEDVYHSVDITQASGDRLDALLDLFGFPARGAAVYSGIPVIFTGDPGVIIPAGFHVSTSSSSIDLYTVTATIISSTGEAFVEAAPNEEIATTLAINEVDTIEVALDGVTSVRNDVGGIVGVEIRGEETDAEIRQRLLGRRNGVRVSNSVLNLESRLRGITGVVEAVLYANSESGVDDRGIPPHAYALVIEGGDDVDIANMLWQHHTVGISTYGSTVIGIQDVQGICHKMRFSRPIDVIALLKITVRYVDGRCGCQPGDLDGLKTKLIELLDENRQDCGGFGIGQPLIRSRLYAAFSDVSGLEIVSLEMAKHYYQFSFLCGTDGGVEYGPTWDSAGFCNSRWAKEYEYTEDSIPIAWNEKPVFMPDGIQLTVLDTFDNVVASDC